MSRKSKLTISFFGGSFDPPHRGHEMMTRVALDIFGVDRVYWVPTRSHAFGKNFKFSLEERVEMCLLATKKFGNRVEVQQPLTVSMNEYDYTYDQLMLHRIDLGDHADFRLLIGADIVKDLPRWHKSMFLLDEIGIDVISRPGYEIPDVGARDMRVHILEDGGIDHSSSKIRSLLDSGDLEKVREMVDPQVFEKSIDRG